MRVSRVISGELSCAGNEVERLLGCGSEEGRRREIRERVGLCSSDHEVELLAACHGHIDAAADLHLAEILEGCEDMGIEDCCAVLSGHDAVLIPADIVRLAARHCHGARGGGAYALDRSVEADRRGADAHWVVV